MSRFGCLVLLLVSYAALGAEPSALVEVYGDPAGTRRLDSVEVLEEGSPSRVVDETFELAVGTHHLRLRRKNFLEATVELQVEADGPRLKVLMQPDPQVQHPLAGHGNLVVAFGEGNPDRSDPLWRQTMDGAGSLSASREGGLRNVFPPFLRQAYEATNFLLVYDVSDPFFSQMLPLEKPPERVCCNSDGSLIFVGFRDELVVYKFGPQLSVQQRHPLQGPLTALKFSAADNLVVAATGPRLLWFDATRGTRAASLSLKWTPEALTVDRDITFVTGGTVVAAYQARPRPRQVALRKVTTPFTDLQIDPVERSLFAASSKANGLWKLDSQSLRPLSRWETPASSTRFWLNAARAYLTQVQSRQLSVLNLATGTCETSNGGSVNSLAFDSSGRSYACLKSPPHVTALDQDGQPLGKPIWFTHALPQDLFLIP